MIKKFRKKPVVIEAVQWDGRNFDEVMNFMQEFHGSKLNYENAEEQAYKTGKLHIHTLEGVVTASEGDIIIKGVNGEFYPCKPDIFEKTYELVEDCQTPDKKNGGLRSVVPSILLILVLALVVTSCSQRTYPINYNTTNGINKKCNYPYDYKWRSPRYP